MASICRTHYTARLEAEGKAREALNEQERLRHASAIVMHALKTERYESVLLDSFFCFKPQDFTTIVSYSHVLSTIRHQPSSLR